MGSPWVERDLLALRLKQWLKLDGSDSAPRFEVYGYFADYDWVLFSQLFGRMLDLPPEFPKFCRDIKQMMDECGIKRSDMPKQKGTAHNALEDARHIKIMHEFLLNPCKCGDKGECSLCTPTKP